MTNTLRKMAAVLDTSRKAEVAYLYGDTTEESQNEV